MKEELAISPGGVTTPELLHIIAVYPTGGPDVFT